MAPNKARLLWNIGACLFMFASLIWMSTGNVPIGGMNIAIGGMFLTIGAAQAKKDGEKKSSESED